MTIRQQLEAKGVHLLGHEFDPALLGWVSRADLRALAAYQIEDFIPIAGAIWGEDKLVDYIREQHAKNTEIVFVDELPDSKAFWAMVSQGLLIWQHLNGSIVGVARIYGQLCALYHRDHALAVLSAVIDDSDTDDISPAIQEFFARNIEAATLGPQTPALLGGAKWPKSDNNGLGPSRAVRQTIEIT